ncbi:MAG: hypothetical protein JWL63_1535 [Rhodocyclales bacterium]|nr:hypothetical protein [Rhodocyclales bacterium]
MLDNVKQLCDLLGKAAFEILHDSFQVVSGPKAFYQNRNFGTKQSVTRALKNLLLMVLVLSTLQCFAIWTIHSVSQPSYLITMSCICCLVRLLPTRPFFESRRG